MKLCMIGSRGHSYYVYESLVESGAELVAISSGSPEDHVDIQLQRAAKCGFIPQVYTDYRAMLDNEKPDIVVIDGPFDQHATMCIEAFQRNINVFCEKPIALTLSDLDRLEAVLRQHPVKLMSMVGLRYESSFQYAHQLVKQGAIGKVKLIQTQKSYKLKKRPEFFKHRATYGGTIPWVGSHALDWILYFGGGDFKTIWAVQSRQDNNDHGDLEVTGQCQFQMSNGVIAQASIDYLRPQSATSHGDDRVRIAGTQGVIEVRGGAVFLIDDKGERQCDVPPAQRHIFSDFVFDVQGERPALTNANETIRLTRGCLMAQEAADRFSLEQL